MKKRNFLQEFKSMLFNYKVIYIFLAYVIISSLIIAAIGYRPVKTFYKSDDPNYTNEINEFKEQYYGMKYGDIETDINEKKYEIMGGDMFTDISDLKKASELNALLWYEIFGGNFDQARFDTIVKELGLSIEKVEKERERVEAAATEENMKKIDFLENVLTDVKFQIQDTKSTSLVDKLLPNDDLIDESDVFYDLRKEGLLLGIGAYFGKNFHFIAWMNAFVLEIFLGIISYSYIRKRKNDSIQSGDMEAYKDDKKNILLSFISISLIMAIFMLIRHFVIVNIKYPREIVDLPIKLFNRYYSGNVTIKTQLIVTMVFSIIYYIARPVIYAKRSEVLSKKKSIMYFIIFNLAMYANYYTVAKYVFVSMTGPGLLTEPIINSIMLIIFILVVVYSYKSFMLGEEYFKRRKADKLTENKDNKNLVNSVGKDVNEIESKLDDVKSKEE